MDCPNCHNELREFSPQCPICTRTLEPAEQEELKRVIAGALARKKATRQKAIIWLAVLFSLAGIITFSLLWRARDRLSAEEHARFKKEMGEAIARVEAWEDARKKGVIQALKDIQRLRSDAPCLKKLPASPADIGLVAQLVPEAELAKHQGIHMEYARSFLGYGEPGENTTGYFNSTYRRLLRGRNLRPKKIEWPQLLEDIKKRSSAPFWDYELLFAAMEHKDAVTEFGEDLYRPGLAAGWALLWDFEQGKVVCIAPFISSHSATISYLQAYSVDKSGKKHKVDRGGKDLALKRDILKNAYDFTATRWRAVPD